MTFHTLFLRRTATFALAALAAGFAHAQTIVLNSAADFAVLGGSTVTNTGATTIAGAVGGLGVSPGTAVTGFPPGVVTSGSIHANDAAATQAKADAATAYSQLAGLAFTTDLSGSNLAGLTLTPGVYKFSSAAALTSGVLTLNGLGQTAPLFVFQIGSTLTTTGTTSFSFINGATTGNTWFQVGTSATLGVGTSFGGTIIANASDTLNTGVTVNGRIFALGGAVTLDTNQITAPSAIPEPSTYAAIAASFALLLAFAHRAGLLRRLLA
jgi:type VI secretion system secreted protein VgrG